MRKKLVLLQALAILIYMLMHGDRRSMVCELLLTKPTTNFKLSLPFTAIFTVQNFFKVLPASTLLFELALLPLVELSHSAAILLKP